MTYVVRRWGGLMLYGEVDRTPSDPDPSGLSQPRVPDYWLEGQWYSIACVEGEWGRVDPRQPDLQEVSRERCERARNLGWWEGP